MQSAIFWLCFQNDVALLHIFNMNWNLEVKSECHFPICNSWRDWQFCSVFCDVVVIPTVVVLQGNTVESEHLSELTEEEYEAHFIKRQDLKGFMWLDAKYLNPFFTRRLTPEVSQFSSSWSKSFCTWDVESDHNYLCRHYLDWMQSHLQELEIILSLTTGAR